MIKLNKKKLELERVIRDTNQKVQKNIGCFFGPVKFILAFSVIVFVCIDIFVMRYSSSLTLLLGMIVLELTVFFIVIAIITALERIIRKKHTLVSNHQSIIVEVKEAKILQTYAETHRNYVPNVREFERLFYLKLLVGGEGQVDLHVNIQTYQRFNKGESIYLIKINGNYDNKYLFSQDEYYLDTVGETALRTPIEIRI